MRSKNPFCTNDPIYYNVLHNSAIIAADYWKNKIKWREASVRHWLDKLEPIDSFNIKNNDAIGISGKIIS